jgi:hypothetical protein
MRAFDQSVVAVLVALCFLTPGTSWAQTIGNAAKVVRDVEGNFQGAVHKIEISSAVQQNELIQTGAESATELHFLDGTTLQLGANSEMLLDEIVFNPDASRNIISLTLKQGLMNFVTGTSPSRAYTIRTPTTVIGIRGTVLSVAVALNGATTVSVTQGLVAVSNLAGITSTVTPGLSTTVAPVPVGGLPLPPTPPAPVPVGLSTQTAQLSTTLSSTTATAGATGATAGANASGAAGGTAGASGAAGGTAGAAAGGAAAASSAAVGGLTVGAVGAAAVAAGIAVGVGSQQGTTATSTAPTNTAP